MTGWRWREANNAQPLTSHSSCFPPFCLFTIFFLKLYLRQIRLTIETNIFCNPDKYVSPLLPHTLLLFPFCLRILPQQLFSPPCNRRYLFNFIFGFHGRVCFHSAQCLQSLHIPPCVFMFHFHLCLLFLSCVFLFCFLIINTSKHDFHFFKRTSLSSSVNM